MLDFNDAVKPAHANGHFYNPVCDRNELREREATLWPGHPRCDEIDFNDKGQLDLLQTAFLRYVSEYDYPEKIEDSENLTQFYTRNSQFSWLDSRALFVLLRYWQPRRLIEVGSGYSSLLVADVNRRFFNNGMDVTCIEPFPRPFLKQGLSGVKRVTVSKVKDVPLAAFESLEAGDVLFIDSSHVAKTGSDVNHLFFNVLPRLNAGVRIHFHDIFLPFEYPKAWTLGENRSWNEQYLLRALLTYSNGYRVLFSCCYAEHRFHAQVATALAHPKGYALSGSSFWIEKTAPALRTPQTQL